MGSEITLDIWVPLDAMFSFGVFIAMTIVTGLICLTPFVIIVAAVLIDRNWRQTVEIIRTILSATNTEQARSVS